MINSMTFYPNYQCHNRMIQDYLARISLAPLTARIKEPSCLTGLLLIRQLSVSHRHFCFLLVRMFNIRHIFQLRGIPRDCGLDFTLDTLALAAPAVFGFSSRCQVLNLLARGFRRFQRNPIYSVPRQVLKMPLSRVEPNYGDIR
jgi:hypothetical protein